MAQLLGRFSEIVAPYHLDKLDGTGGAFTFADVAANWKSMRDVDNEGYHVATAHPVCMSYMEKTTTTSLIKTAPH